MTFSDFLKKKSKTLIEVVFINDVDQSIIGCGELLAEELPNAFIVNTIMHLGDEDWEVIEADPDSKTEFLKTKKLTLVLKRVAKMNPTEILFSLPTVANELPVFSETTFSTNFVHEMREDDWRQCEFFDVHQKGRILNELKKIEDLKQNHQVKRTSGINAFNKIHVRDLVDVPELSLSLLALLNLLQVSEVGAVVFENNRGYIAQGFAVETASNIFYGTLGLEDIASTALENLVIRVLGVQPKTDNRDEISQLLQEFNLLYVDWCDTTSMDRLN